MFCWSTANMGCWNRMKTKVKETFSPPGTLPIPTMYLITTSLSSFAASMIVTMPYSFLPKMMKSFGIVEKDVGYYVGLVASCLFGGFAIGSIFWGWLCDRIGSKKCILITGSLLSLQTLFFGLSRSFQWAITTRFLQGLLGGFMVSVKASLFRMCHKTKNPVGVAIALSSYQCGLIAGPALGGFLVFPREKYPNIIPKGSILDTFPFLLPIIVMCSLFLVVFVMACLFISSEPRESDSEKTHLLAGSSGNQIEETKLEQKLTNGFAGHAVGNNADKNNVTVAYFKGKKNRRSGHWSSCCTSCCNFFKETSLYKMTRSQAVVLSLSLYGVVAFVNNGFDELFPIFADSSTQYGGLGFTTDQIGTALLAASIPLVCMTVALDKVDHCLGTKKLSIVGNACLLFLSPLFPYVGAVNKSSIWSVLIPLLFLMRFLIDVSYFTANVLIFKSVNPQYMGSVSGLSMTVNCFFGSLSPTVLGSLYSWSLRNEGKVGYPFNHFFPFVICGFLEILAIFLAAIVPKDLAYANIKLDIDNNPTQSLHSDKSDFEAAVEDNVVRL